MVDEIALSSSQVGDDEMHVVPKIPEQVNDKNNPSCLGNESSQLDLNKLMSLSTDLKDTHENERELAIAQTSKFEAANKLLIDNQTKM